ncbi:MAG: hypothetical protein ACD_64C00314G0004 [uncultured bacterium]|nr:MAG: hypothetical protein ACD_64C00314G0004 [uncultured bacterium]
MNIRIRSRVLFALNFLLIGSMFSPFVKADTLAMSQERVNSVRQELAANVQHFAFVSYDLVLRTTKNKAENTAITVKEQKVVERIEQSYLAEISHIRSLLYAETPSIEQAVKRFGDYVFLVCREFGLKNKYFMNFPAKIDSSDVVENQLAVIKQAVGALEVYFDSIKPVAPLTVRIKNKLFYNFVSTKLAPKVLRIAVGPVLACIWAVRNAKLYDEAIHQHPHKNIFKNYVAVEHDKEQDVVNEPSIIGKMLGMKSERTRINSCRTAYYSDHVCNGDQSSMMQHGFQGYNHNLEQCTVEWAKKCSSDKACAKCYSCNGHHSPETIVKNIVWAARPLVLFPVFNALSQAVEEAQLPEYERRIKEKEKAEQEKRVQQEMRRMKVNYEKTIGFNQIKGQRDLIDREMKMLVDYLSNPLRYNNSASGTRSILMYGPPGTGKTLMARAIAKESGAPFIEITADDIMSDDSKEKVLAAIRMAEGVAAKRPEKSAIIYIDEIDAVTGNRQNGALDPQRAKALSNLLTIFDGIEKRNPFVHIVIIITTNHYKNLDPALLRPGRIDRKILITQPNAAGREEFFEMLLPEEHKGYMNWLVQETAGYSGAQIVNIVDTAKMIASYNNRSMPDEHDYKAALQNSKVEQEEIPEAAKIH